MRAVVQRVTRAAVRVDGEVVSVVGAPDEPALCVLLGVTHDDGPEEAVWVADKIANLRILRDPDKATSYMASRAAENLLEKRGIPHRLVPVLQPIHDGGQSTIAKS